MSRQRTLESVQRTALAGALTLAAAVAVMLPPPARAAEKAVPAAAQPAGAGISKMGIKNPPGGLVRKEECLKFLNNEYLYKLSDGINSLG